jgi:hypothetical protein
MADDAGGGAAPVPAQVGGDHDTGHPAQQNIDRIPLHNQSRKSTLSKSGFDMHASGTATPMTGGKRDSRHEIQLDDYFVGVLDSFCFLGEIIRGLTGKGAKRHVLNLEAVVHLSGW